MIPIVWKPTNVLNYIPNENDSMSRQCETVLFKINSTALRAIAKMNLLWIWTVANELQIQTELNEFRIWTSSNELQPWTVLNEREHRSTKTKERKNWTVKLAGKWVAEVYDTKCVRLDRRLRECVCCQPLRNRYRSHSATFCLLWSVSFWTLPW